MLIYICCHFSTTDIDPLFCLTHVKTEEVQSGPWRKWNERNCGWRPLTNGLNWLVVCGSDFCQVKQSYTWLIYVVLAPINMESHTWLVGYEEELGSVGRRRVPSLQLKYSTGKCFGQTGLDKLSAKLQMGLWIFMQAQTNGSPLGPTLPDNLQWCMMG